MGLKTPVAFLVFNRPDTTQQVFTAIRQARPETLLVVADGPRPDRYGEADLCAATRAIIDQVDWPCDVLTNYADSNMGCKQRISSGLDWVFGQVEEAIVLEDDCLPHPSFFPFCEQLLERYRDDERVMMIGGTNYLLDRLVVPESYFFSRYFAIWGWASWRRAWGKYDIAMKEWERFRSENQVKSFFSQKFMQRYVTDMFDAAYQNRINTWDIQWFYSGLFNNGMSAVSKVNLISNIGICGTHTSGDTSNNFFPTYDIEVDDLKHPCQVYPNFVYDDELFTTKLKSGLAGVVKKMRAVIKKRSLPWFSKV